MEEEEKTQRCAACRRLIRLGDDVLAIERGVIGPRGVVLLGSPVIVCSDECASDYFSEADRPTKYTMHRKIP